MLIFFAFLMSLSGPKLLQRFNKPIWPAVAVVEVPPLPFETPLDEPVQVFETQLDTPTQLEKPLDMPVLFELPLDTPAQALQAEEQPSREIYRVKLSKQKMPIYTVGDVVYYRSAYYGNLEVGSPAVLFKVVFDTGSGHLILPSTYCHSDTCRVHRRYRRSASVTGSDIDYDGTRVAPGSARDQITVSFGTGEVTGVFVEDVVCMNDRTQELNTSTDLAEGAERPGCVTLRMIAATEMSEDPFKSFQFDGVLGLGLPGLSQTPAFNFLDVFSQSVHRWGAGNQPQTFAVFLAENAAEDSEVSFGGWAQERLAEDLSWNGVLDPEMGHWTLAIRSMRVNDETVSFCNEGCKAVVDTGTSLFAVPTAAFPEIYELLKHPAPQLGHCRGAGPELHIELETATVTLEPRDYARVERSTKKASPSYRPNAPPKNGTGPKQRTDLFCKPMLMALDLPAPLGPKLFILGEPVLRKYYTVYDAAKKMVGIAKAHHRKGARPAEFLLAGGDVEPRGSIFKEFRRRRLQA